MRGNTLFKSVLTLAMTLAAVSAPTASNAATLILDAIADNTLYAEDGTRSNGAGPALFAGNNGPGDERRALLRFDLSAIPAGATITGVTLNLYATSTGSNGPGTHLSLHRLNSDWGEGSSANGGDTGGGGNGAPAATGDATWTHNFFDTSSWLSDGGDFIATASATTAGQLGANTWSGNPMVNDVQNWLDGNTPNFGWILLGDTSLGSTAYRFGSRENGIAGYQPSLAIDYSALAVPLPGTALLFATGLALAGTLAGRARRR